ncbi:MAG: long-chain fatty acid--CoA ligase [Candidatus Dormibacteraeota bacterium]|nr:long-chain fatty acid--CoA ligase [Candidatus Dormibacteraeota bacterium]
MSTQTLSAEQEPAPARAGAATLVELFLGQVRSRGASPALMYRGGDRFVGISWSDFGAAAERWSAFLLSEDVAEQDHVAIWSNNRPEWHIADIGILSVRGRPVPVYLTLSAEQGGYVLGHSESRVVVVEDDSLRDRVLEVRADLPSLRRIVVVSTDEESSHDGFVLSWQRALQQGSEALASQRAELERRRAAVAPDDIATLIYTSGTTGPPKAVQLTHGNCTAAINALEEFVPSGPDDRVLSYLPLAHIAERLSTEFRSYAYGNRVFFLDGFEHLGERLREVRPTAFFAVPRVWEKMALQVQKAVDALSAPQRVLARWALRAGARAAEHGGAGEARAHRLADRLVLRKLRERTGLEQASILASGAAPIAADVLRFFASFGLEVLEVYGQTEDTGLTTMNRPGRSRIGTVGFPLRGNDVRIAEDGEILVRGPVVFHGYYKEDAATAETLTDHWLHTGDVGEFDADGYLRITDRKKDLIITAGGKNISPTNIEQLLQQLRLIGNAVAIGDRRPFVSALLTLDPEEAAAYAKEHGLGADHGGLAEDETLRREIAAHVDSVNRQLSHVEQVKKWTLIGHAFEVGDELTPTMKVKRKVVAEKYADEIEGMYRR